MKNVQFSVGWSLRACEKKTGKRYLNVTGCVVERDEVSSRESENILQMSCVDS